MAEHGNEESAGATERLLQDAAGRAARYLAGLDERAVAPEPAVADLCAQLSAHCGAVTGHWILDRAAPAADID